MKIHEYQAKELLKRFGVPVLRSQVAMTAEEAGEKTYNDFVQNGVNTVVIKSQVHAGGRGKGYIKNIESGENIKIFDKEVRGVNVLHGGDIANKAYEYAKAMLGNKLVTIQTGDGGAIVNKVLIEEGTSIEKEYYLSITLDRAKSQNTIIASTEGGMDIEKVAEESPEKIIKERIDPKIGFADFQARRLAIALGFKGAAYKNFIATVKKLVEAYHKLDCSILEINPLVLTADQEIIALDAKMIFDDNAMFRHPEYLEMRDIAEEEALEVEAAKYNLNYIKLDGNVGCMVNGAGLAMATMDLIKHAGGSPANFLDVGGAANVDRISHAFKIMTSDPKVQAILVNIFGGIVRCDKVADGIIKALETIKVDLPVIVRLDGTNAKEAHLALKNSGLKFLVAKDFHDAAEKVTHALKN